ncbi:MAG: response regulator [Tepidisphaeraceae bacterium]
MCENHNKPLKILLIDDDPDCRMLIRDAINDCDVSNSVWEASNGEEALRMLSEYGEASSENLPGLIYLDIEMPRLDGIETLKRIKSDDRLKHIPVVMMTGVSDEQQMERAANYGANSYTLKPANADEFLSMVQTSTRYWLGVHQYPHRRLAQSACRR